MRHAALSRDATLKTRASVPLQSKKSAQPDGSRTSIPKTLTASTGSSSLYATLALVTVFPSAKRLSAVYSLGARTGDNWSCRRATVAARLREM
jgi:hypothetical protein